MWRPFGHASLADYMVQELGYSSHRVAEDRLRLANALPALPRLSEALQNGDLNFSQARELARIATPETEQAWIDKAHNLNARQVEQAVAGHTKGDLPDDPVDPRLVRKTIWMSVRPETEVLFREAKQALEKERGERLDEDAVMEALCRTFLARGHSAAPTTDDAESVPRGTEPGSKEANDSAAVGAPYRIAVTICWECRRGWRHGGGAVAEMSPASVECAECDAQWIGDLDSDQVERARQAISPATRRKVLHRDQERCQAPACQCHSNLDVHHIVHREHGGTNDLSNLVTLCEAHHLAHHDGTLVVQRIGGEVTFKREGRNAFTRATREVATRQVLRERGFAREHIAHIIARTVNRIGATDLSEDQWLAIALEYAAQLTSSRQ